MFNFNRGVGIFFRVEIRPIQQIDFWDKSYRLLRGVFVNKVLESVVFVAGHRCSWDTPRRQGNVWPTHVSRNSLNKPGYLCVNRRKEPFFLPEYTFPDRSLCLLDSAGKIVSNLNLCNRRSVNRGFFCKHPFYCVQVWLFVCKFSTRLIQSNLYENSKAKFFSYFGRIILLINHFKDHS